MSSTKAATKKKKSTSKHSTNFERTEIDKYDSVCTLVRAELAAAVQLGERSAFSFAIQDLTEATTISNYDVLIAWDRLLTAIEKENHVFSEYFDFLENVYEQIKDETLAANAQHVYTLLNLLTQAVQSHQLDPSIACRFVTLLEVVRSYSSSWQRPSEILEAYWLRLLQRIPPKVTTVGFRKRAYRVLVSLSWVPSTKGLLEACSFEEQKEIGVGSYTNLDIVRTRWDILNQLLDRLKDETDVCVGITSRQPGVGKSTLAAQVSSHPSIRRVFKVIWLQVSEPLTYDNYYSHLKDMLSQVGLNCDLEGTVTRRLEEPALLRIREQRSMKLLKTQMATYLEDTVFLLVLDQVQSPDKIIPWFRFHSCQSIIVTTASCTNGGTDSSLDWCLELDDVWSIDEAVDLLLHEADLPAHLAYSSEVRDLCKNARPLTIRVLARWLRLKKVSIGHFPAVNEVCLALKALGSKEHPLFDVLSLMMGPKSKGGKGMTVLFLLCFSSFCTVFPDGGPLEAVLMTWEEILSIEPLAANDIADSSGPDRKRYPRWMAEGLFHMGVISIRYKPGKEGTKVPWVDCHHRFYKEFAIVMAREMDLRESFAETIIDWNAAFVTGYFARKSQLKDCLEYGVEHLQTHMIYAHLFDTAAKVLSEKEFFDLRVKTMGWERAMTTQIQDCINIQDGLETGQTSRSSVLQATSSLFRGRSSALESSKALYSLALALAQNGYFSEAISQFKVAESLPQNKKQKAAILYGIAWCMYSSNLPARVKLDDCRHVMEEDTTEHELYNEMLILVADILVEDCEYQEASCHFERILEKFRADPDFNPIELGVTLFKYGKLFYLTGNTVQAKETLEECIKWKRDNEETSRSLCDALGILGDIQQELGLPSAAKESYEAALHTLNFLECDESHLDYRLLAAKVQVLRNDVPGSLESFELVRKTSVASPLLLLDQSSYDLKRCIARAYEEYDNISESVGVLRESLSLTLDRPNSLERAAGMVALGNCLILLDAEQEALDCYHEAHDIQRDRLGDASPVVIDTNNMIGHALLALGDYDAAIKLFESSYEKTRQVNPKDIERLAGVLYLTADAYEAKGKYSDAAWNFNQCLGYLKRDRSADHPDIAKTLQRLADTTCAQGDIEMAYGYYSHAVNIRRKHKDQEMLSEALLGLGKLEKQRRDFEKAEASLSESLNLHQSEGNDTSDCLIELGHVYSLKSEFGSAAKAYESVCETSAIAEASQLCLIHLKLARGEFGAALQGYKELETSPETLVGSAMANFLMGNSKGAMSDLDATKQLSCPSNWRSVSLLLEGDILEFSGQEGDARAAWAEASSLGSLSVLTERRINGGVGYLSGLDTDVRDQESSLLRNTLLLQSALG